MVLETSDQTKARQKRASEVLFVMALAVTMINGAYYQIRGLGSDNISLEQQPVLYLLFVVSALLLIAAAYLHDRAKGVSQRITLLRTIIALSLSIGAGVAYGLFGESGGLFQ